MYGASARNTDPDTAHLAAQAMRLSVKQTVVHMCIKVNGFHGATRDEIAIMADMKEEKDTISPRMMYLLAEGLIKRCHNGRRYFKRKGVITGRMQIVNFATEFYDLERFI